MPQFTPEPREGVKDHLEENGSVKAAHNIRDGLRVELSSPKSITNLNGFCRLTGWFVDSVDWDRRVLYMFPMNSGVDE